MLAGWHSRLEKGATAFLLLAAIGLVHRAALFVSWRPDLDALLAQNADYYSWQFLALPALRDHLGLSLLYLQQSPPLPNLILGLLLQVATLPYQLAYSLLALQTLITLAATLLFFHLLRRQLGRPLVAFAFALLFLLGPDLLFLEYNTFGQSFYENLTQLLLLATLAALDRVLRQPSPLACALLGLAIGLLPLTRSTFSYFPLVFVAFLFLLPLRSRPRRLALVAALALGLPLLWAAKQWAVYGDFRLATSSWAGANAVQGLVKAGFETPFRNFLAQQSRHYPDYFKRLIAHNGLVDWRWEPAPGELPADILARDAAIDAVLGGTNRKENSVAQASVFALYARAWRDFLLANPAIALAKLYRSSKLFFFPIRYHAAPFLRCEWRLDPAWPPWRIAAELFEGKLPEPYYLAAGTWPESRPSRPAFTYTLDRPAILWQSLLLWTLLLYSLPLALPYRLFRLAQALRRGERVAATEWLLPAALLAVGYGALLANLVEFGENQRFRLALEPLLWLLVLATITRRPQPDIDSSSDVET